MNGENVSVKINVKCVLFTRRLFTQSMLLEHLIARIIYECYFRTTNVIKVLGILLRN